MAKYSAVFLILLLAASAVAPSTAKISGLRKGEISDRTVQTLRHLKTGDHGDDEDENEANDETGESVTEGLGKGEIMKGVVKEAKEENKVNEKKPKGEEQKKEMEPKDEDGEDGEKGPKGDDGAKDEDDSDGTDGKDKMPEKTQETDEKKQKEKKGQKEQKSKREEKDESEDEESDDIKCTVCKIIELSGDTEADENSEDYDLLVRIADFSEVAAAFGPPADGGLEGMNVYAPTDGAFSKFAEARGWYTTKYNEEAALQFIIANMAQSVDYLDDDGQESLQEICDFISEEYLKEKKNVRNSLQCFVAVFLFNHVSFPAMAPSELEKKEDEIETATELIYKVKASGRGSKKRSAGKMKGDKKDSKKQAPVKLVAKKGPNLLKFPKFNGKADGIPTQNGYIIPLDFPNAPNAV